MSMTIDTADSAGAEAQPAADEKRRRRLLRRKSGAPSAVELARPKRRSRKKWVAAGLAVVLLAGGGSAWALTRGGTTVAAPTSRTITSTITTGSVSKSVQASGTVAAANVADLTFPSAGTVNSVKVTVGETVTKGQALASIDKTSLQLAVNSAQASYNQTAAQLSSAQANLAADRAALAATKASATTSTGTTGATGSTGTSATDIATQETNEQAQIDSANAQIAGDESQLAGAQDKLNSAKANLAGATITSPIAGTVSAVNISVGDTASGSGAGGSSSGGSGGGSGSGSSHGTGSSAVSPSATTSSSAAIEVVNLKSWVVNATVSGADLDSIKVGQEATITTSGSNQPVFGTVASVGVTASSTSGGAAQFPVTIDVTGTPTTLHPGDTATVAITTQQLSDVLTVPTAAIKTVNGQTVVTKLVNGAPQQAVVVLGASYGQQTIVTSGLADGDQIQYTITGLASRAGGTGRTGTGTGRTGRTGTGTGTGAGAAGGFGGGNFPAGGFGGFGGGN